MQPTKHDRAFLAFGTAVRISVFGDAEAMDAALAEAQRACEAYEGLFSRHVLSSDIARINAAGGEAVPIDPRTADLLRQAMRYCAASEGAFDITVEPAVRLWDLEAGCIPSKGALADAVRHIGWQKLDLWAQCGGNWFARLGDAQASVDVGGIAKGWIADRLGELLMRRGASGAVIDLGGNVLVRGSKPDGSPWRVGIREPVPSAEQPGILMAVPLAGGSLVTSGVYERFFMRDGKRYHHILDPASGWPIDTPWAGVSVLAERSIDAEGFSTTLLALGLERSRTLAEQHPEILQAYFTAWDGSIASLR